MKPRILFTTGALLFVVAWALPVVKDGVTLSGGLPGWEAFRVAASPLWPYEGVAADTWYHAALTVLSAATNLLMFAVLALSVRRRDYNRAAGIAAIIAFAVNAQWVLQAGVRSDLRIGYYAWWLSFLLVGCGLLLVRRVSTQSLAAAAQRGVVADGAAKSLG